MFNNFKSNFSSLCPSIQNIVRLRYQNKLFILWLQHKNNVKLYQQLWITCLVVKPLFLWARNSKCKISFQFPGKTPILWVHYISLYMGTSSPQRNAVSVNKTVIPLFIAQFVRTVVNKRHRSSLSLLCCTNFSHICSYKFESQRLIKFFFSQIVTWLPPRPPCCLPSIN